MNVVTSQEKALPFVDNEAIELGQYHGRHDREPEDCTMRACDCPCHLDGGAVGCAAQSSSEPGAQTRPAGAEVSHGRRPPAPCPFSHEACELHRVRSSCLNSLVTVEELTEAEGTELFDRITRRAMGMSGAEFLRRWDAGEWRGIDLDSVPGLVDVWMALPFARQTFTEWVSGAVSEAAS